MKLDPLKKDDYLIMTAMRGPDDNWGDYDLSHNVKLFTTACLRYLVGGKEGLTPAYVRNPEVMMEKWNERSIPLHDSVKGFLRKEAHFREHFGQGLSAVVRRLKRNNKKKPNIETVALIIVAEKYRTWVSKTLGIYVDY